MSLFRTRRKIRWRRVVLAVVLGYLALLALSAVLTHAAKSFGGGLFVLLLIGFAVALRKSPKLRRQLKGSMVGGRRGKEALVLRFYGGVFPEATLRVTEDGFNPPWPARLREAHRRKEPLVVVPTDGQHVSDFGCLVRVTSVDPLFELTGIRRVRVLRSRPEAAPANPNGNVFYGTYMELDEEVDEAAVAPLARSLPRLFLQWTQSQPEGAAYRRSIEGVTDPLVLGNRIAQAVTRSNPFHVNDILRSDDVAFRLRRCVDLLKEAGARPGGGSGADQFRVEEPDDLPRFSDVGGMEGLKTQLRDNVDVILRSRAGSASITVNGILLHGPPGTGKTIFARATAGEFGLRCLTVSGGDVAGSLVGESESRLRTVFGLAEENAPCLLFIDEIDSLAGRRGEGGGNQDLQRRVVTQLLRSIDELRRREGVVLMAATNDLDALDPAAVRSGRFDFRARVDLPDAAARVAILAVTLRSTRCAADVSLEKVAARAEGRTAADLAAAAEAAKVAALRRTPAGGEVEITAADLDAGLRALGGGDRPTLVPVRWDELVLPADTSSQLERLVELIVDPESGEGLVTAPSGALLYGPPGTGKTTIARAIATACEGRASFLPVKGSDIRSKWAGEGAKHVRDLFARARAAAPCIVFIDEIDSVLPARVDDGPGAGSADGDIVTEFLVQLDGIDSRPGVFVLGATNHPDRVDPAALRGGRIGRRIEIPLPDTAGREHLLALHLRPLAHADDIDPAAIARLTERYSGADIEALCQEAGGVAFEREGGPRLVGQADLLEALRRRRSVSRTEARTWDQVVLPADALQQLRSLASQMADPERARQHGLKPVTGALLWGPPGTGKTTIAQVLAHELAGDVAFLTAKGSDLKSKWIGDGEKKLRDLFDRARAQTPALIFIDEIDALVPSRDGAHESAQAMVAEFLQQLDGIDSTPGVFVLGATNLPDNVDRAVLRPGRLGRRIFIPLPDEESRRRLFALYTAGMPLDMAVDLSRLSAATDGASGADIEGLCNDAAELSYLRDLDAAQNRGGDTPGKGGGPSIRADDFDAAIGRWRGVTAGPLAAGHVS